VLSRWRLSLPRLACGVTGIAGGFALGFQGDFPSRLLRHLLGGPTDRLLLQALGLRCAGCLASVARLSGPNRVACRSTTAGSSARGRARNFSSAACLAFGAVLSRSLKSSLFLKALIRQVSIRVKAREQGKARKLLPPWADPDSRSIRRGVPI
jgi:hypothetical protein